MEAYEYQTPFVVGETTNFNVDFTQRLDATANETIVSATYSIKCLNAVDSQVGSMLVGNSVILGSVVGHSVTGGIAGHRYMITVTVVTSASKTRKFEGILRVVA